MINRIEEIKNYRKLVSQANKESIKKEVFKDFDRSEEAVNGKFKIRSGI